MSELPPGFELDHTEAAIPPGFTLDSVGMGEDAAKSVGAGLGSAAIGTLGLPGDISNALAHGSKIASDYIAGKMGFEPSPELGKNILPTSADIKSTVTDPIVSPDYQPQYATGEIAKKLGEFAPNVAFGGGARTLAQNVAGPAIGSWAGEKAGGPVGEIAGALLGGVGTSAMARKFQEMAAARTAAKALPSGEDLVKAGSGQFDAARDMNVVVKPDFATNTAADMRSALKDFDPEDASVKDVFRKIDRLDGLGVSSAVEMNDIENVRKQLSKLKMSPDGATREAARTAQEVLTKNQMALTGADAVSGDAPLYSQTMRDAVGNYGAGKRSNTVTGKVDLAELNSGTAGSGANQDNNLRQAIKQLARPMNNTNVPVARKLGFNNEETAAIKTAATGTMAGNAARYIGKAAPTGIVSAALGAEGGHIIGGPIGAVGLPVAGYIAKKIGDLSTKRAVAAVDSLVRSRSPLAAHVASQLPQQIIQQLPAKSQRLLQTLILANPSLGQAAQQQSQPVGQPNTQ